MMVATCVTLPGGVGESQPSATAGTKHTQHTQHTTLFEHGFVDKVERRGSTVAVVHPKVVHTCNMPAPPALINERGNGY